MQNWIKSTNGHKMSPLVSEAGAIALCSVLEGKGFAVYYAADGAKFRVYALV